MNINQTMRDAQMRKTASRETHFESLELRLAMTAEPLGDFFLEDAVELAPTLQVNDLVDPLSSVHAQTGVDYARSTYGFTGAGQTVAVIDSGVAWDHYALGGGFGSGYRVVGGWDFTEENDADPYDDGPAGFHGTHVAGIIGSDDATYPGVAPDVDIVALRVFNDQGAGYFSWVEDALSWVHDNLDTFENPITTVNLSLGTTWNADSIPNWAMLEDEFAQLEADGVFISVAAGNAFSTYNTAGLSYPAASPYVTPVASVDSSGAFSSFSQRNSRVLAAPGSSITSTVPDYVFGADGIPNDFGTASGTSMAAPYVAGASVLLRQAMELAGNTSITQDVLYDQFRNSADLFYDPATSATYHRLNVQQAIDDVMPADDYGSTAGSAFSLGTLSGDTSLSGLIGRLDDVDYFTFTAAATGQVTLTAETTHELTASWTVIAGQTIDGSSIAIDTIAGQTYTVGLATSAGLGLYSVQIDVSAGLQIQSQSQTDGNVSITWVDPANSAAHYVILQNDATGQTLQQGWVYGDQLNQTFATGTYNVYVAAPGSSYSSLQFAVQNNTIEIQSTLQNSGETQISWNDPLGSSVFHVIVQNNETGDVSQQGWIYGTSITQDFGAGDYSVYVASPSTAYVTHQFTSPADQVELTYTSQTADQGVVSWDALPGTSVYYVNLQTDNGATISAGWVYGTQVAVNQSPGTYLVRVAAPGQSFAEITVQLVGVSSTSIQSTLAEYSNTAAMNASTQDAFFKANPLGLTSSDDLFGYENEDSLNDPAENLLQELRALGSELASFNSQQPQADATRLDYLSLENATLVEDDNFDLDFLTALTPEEIMDAELVVADQLFEKIGQ